MKFCVRLFIIFTLFTLVPTFGMNKSYTFNATSKVFKDNVLKAKGNFPKNIGKSAYYSTKLGSLSNKNLFKKFTVDGSTGLSKASDYSLINSVKNFGNIQKVRNYSTSREKLSINQVQNKVDAYLHQAIDLYDTLIKNKEECYKELISLREHNYSGVDLELFSQKINHVLASTHEREKLSHIDSELDLILSNYSLRMDYIEKHMIPFQKSGPVYNEMLQELDGKIIKEAEILKNICLIVEPLVKPHFGTLLMEAVGEKIFKDTLSFVINNKVIDIRAIITNKVNFCKQGINSILEGNQDFIKYSNAFYEKKYNELEQKTMTLDAFKNIAHSYIKHYIDFYVKNRSQEFVDNLEGLINKALDYRAMSPFDRFKEQTKSTLNTLNVQRASVWEKTKESVKGFFKNMFNNK